MSQDVDKSFTGSDTENSHTNHGNVVLEVDSLSVEYATKRGPLPAIRDLSLSIREGEIFGVAGESGSGKSTLALSILQYLGTNGRITSGAVSLRGKRLDELSKNELQSVRGKEIAHVPQDAKKSLNPSITVGEQISETIEKHQDVPKAEAKQRALSILREVNIPDPEINASKYPHELSGGQQQRILIGMALSCHPDLLILDEPTTGLDVTTEAKILDRIQELQSEFETTIVLITHDLGVIAEVSDRVAIMYAGEIMERGKTVDVFTEPANPYTQGLLNATPKIRTDQRPVEIAGTVPDLTDLPSGCTFADRCEFATDACRTGSIALESVSSDQVSRCVRWEHVQENPLEATEQSTRKRERGEPMLEAKGIKKTFDRPSMIQSLIEQSRFGRYLASDPPLEAVSGVDISIHESETVGLVGESGSGKSTLARTLLKLLEPTEGEIRYRDDDITDRTGSSLREFYSDVQIVFQNPHSSLNPRKTIEEIVARPLALYTDLARDARVSRVRELLDQVDISEEYLDRYPHELSGGENQRVAIARAFAPDPSLVILDEPVSALDVSVQAKILNLLDALQSEYSTSYLFISHDLSVINSICDRINVMYLGEIVERGTSEEIFNPPHHPYTRALLSSIPSLDPDHRSDPIQLEGEIPSPRNRPSGCAFHTRCPQKIGDICETEKPELDRVDEKHGTDHCASCHLDVDDMNKSATSSRNE